MTTRRRIILFTLEGLRSCFYQQLYALCYTWRYLHAVLAGGHVIGAPALALLEWQLLGSVIKGLGQGLGPGGSLDAGLSEKGTLQLLFDVRFLREVLGGGRPLSAAPEPAR